MNPTATKGLQISMPTDTTIVLTRTFNAPRRLVWEAMFTPDKMRRWMLPPPGWTTTVCEVATRVGGALNAAWKSADADPAMTLRGVFTEVVLHERAVHTETMALLGSGPGDRCTLVEKHEFAEKADGGGRHHHDAHHADVRLQGSGVTAVPLRAWARAWSPATSSSTHCSRSRCKPGGSLRTRATRDTLRSCVPLHYSVNVTLDGCVDPRAGSTDEELHRFWAEKLAGADALLFGRVTYEMMQAAWRWPANGVRPAWMAQWMEPFARTIDAAKKYVVSSTLLPSSVDFWNAELVRGFGEGR